MSRFCGAIIFAFILVSGCNLFSYGQTGLPGIFPDHEWKVVPNPEQDGWNLKKLDGLKTYLVDSTCITGFMMVQNGRIIFEYGDVKENSYIASCRKSVLAILYGAYVKSGVINLQRTLQELEIDDIGGLLCSEKEATVQDLLTARSGVYHPASYPGDYLDIAPGRGTKKHGSFWLYSNWDFNTAGYIFEMLTHKNIYDEVEAKLALPLQMQDWQRSLQQKEGDSSRSVYPAYPMWFSTRDMARIGLLMLNKGKWNNAQVIDPDWVNEMIKPYTGYGEVNANIPTYRNTGYSLGYGYLWWIWQHMPDKRFDGAYAALGAMGQAIAVFPVGNIVIAYKTKSDYGRSNSFLQRFRVLSLAVESLQ